MPAPGLELSAWVQNASRENTNSKDEPGAVLIVNRLEMVHECGDHQGISSEGGTDVLTCKVCQLCREKFRAFSGVQLPKVHVPQNS